MRAKIKILKIEERKVLQYDGLADGKPVFSEISTGWWATLDTDPKISICLGPDKPAENDTTLTIEASL